MNPLTLTLLAAIAVAVTACNTVAGMGADIQAGGRAIEKVAR